MFAQRLRETRAMLGLNQKTFAARLRVSQNSLSNWENGKYLPDVMSLLLICKEANVSADWLLGLPAMEPKNED